ncbi:SDR family oxidoreductase [Pelobacter seleniigenes]|uniref:SDR family oxidoreductase n=1 Tax=Pelobacter seleniigenes TaxID=407188 RepID=UPI0004A6D93B|nr:SDR family oxidoreductase [Pelobacter seleniigenes]
MILPNYTIVGCGDIGLRVARELISAGHRVQATAHFAERGAALEQEGIRPIVANFDYQDEVPELLVHGHGIFYFLPPQGGGSSDYRMVNFCRRLSVDNCPSKLVYISTSGVYGDCGGQLVTEETPLNPLTSRAKRRVSAETQLGEAASRLGFELVILRVTGIYGPGRLPFAQLQKGHQVLRPEESPLTNRIHSLDLVRICLAAMERGKQGDVFNVCDGHPSSMSEYFTQVAETFGFPVPEQLTMAEAERVMNPLTLSFLKESRRMSNRKMLAELQIELAYPDLASGLPACEVDL